MDVSGELARLDVQIPAGIWTTLLISPHDLRQIYFQVIGVFASKRD
jgi:hypothetical protein